MWASSADHKQETELSKREKWLVPFFTIKSNWIIYMYFNNNFYENNFFKIQTNTLQMLCEKYKNLICIIKWAVATYVKEKKKFDPICPFSTHRGTYHKLFYFCDFWPNFFTQCTYKHLKTDYEQKYLDFGPKVPLRSSPPPVYSTVHSVPHM